MSIEAWRVAAEEEHYDSSPSPVSCYDTASESGPYGNEILPGELLYYKCLSVLLVNTPIVRNYIEIKLFSQLNIKKTYRNLVYI